MTIRTLYSYDDFIRTVYSYDDLKSVVKVCGVPIFMVFVGKPNPAKEEILIDVYTENFKTTNTRIKELFP